MAQLSTQLYEQLPDSLKPANRLRVTMTESRKIIINAKLLSLFPDTCSYEIERLACRLLSADLPAENPKQYFEDAAMITKYWVNLLPGGRGIDSCKKYIAVYKLGINKKILSDPLHLANYHLYQGTLLTIQRLYPQAYDNLIKGISGYKKLENHQLTAYTFGVLAYMFRELSLEENAVANIDSAMHYMHTWKITKSVNKRLLSLAEGSILANKARAFCNLFGSTGKKAFGDSAIKVAQTVLSANYTHLNQEALSVLCKVYYFRGDYRRCITFSGMMPTDLGKIPSVNDKNIYIYRALSLINLKRAAEGKKLLASVDSVFGNGPEAAGAATELYAYYKKNGDSFNALRYHEKLLVLQNSYNSPQYIKEVIDVQEHYENLAQNLAFENLKSQEQKKRYVAALILAVISLILIIVAIQYWNGVKNTARLLQHIDELSQLQILHIEEEKEKERKRIGQQLHDDLSTTIAAGIRLLNIKAEDALDPELKSSLVSIAEMLESSYEKSRGKSHELYFESSTGQFCHSLLENINLFFSGTGIEVDTTIDMIDTALSAETKTTVVLILKEAITNIIKHSRATQVKILAYDDQGCLILRISDNGKGITARSSQSLGLKSIGERVSNLNGTFELIPLQPAGVQLSISIPIKMASGIY